MLDRNRSDAEAEGEGSGEAITMMMKDVVRECRLRCHSEYGMSFEDVLKCFEREWLTETLRVTEGNLTRASIALRMPPTTLLGRCRRLGMDYHRFKKGSHDRRAN